MKTASRFAKSLLTMTLVFACAGVVLWVLPLFLFTAAEMLASRRMLWSTGGMVYLMAAAFPIGACYIGSIWFFCVPISWSRFFVATFATILAVAVLTVSCFVSIWLGLGGQDLPQMGMTFLGILLAAVQFGCTICAFALIVSVFGRMIFAHQDDLPNEPRPMTRQLISAGFLLVAPVMVSGSFNLAIGTIYQNNLTMMMNVINGLAIWLIGISLIVTMLFFLFSAVCLLPNRSSIRWPLVGSTTVISYVIFNIIAYVGMGYTASDFTWFWSSLLTAHLWLLTVVPLILGLCLLCKQGVRFRKVRFAPQQTPADEEEVDPFQ